MSNSVNAAGAVADYTYVGKGSDTGNVKDQHGNLFKITCSSASVSGPAGTSVQHRTGCRAGADESDRTVTDDKPALKRSQGL